MRPPADQPPPKPHREREFLGFEQAIQGRIGKRTLGKKVGLAEQTVFGSYGKDPQTKSERSSPYRTIANRIAIPYHFETSPFNFWKNRLDSLFRLCHTFLDHLGCCHEPPAYKKLSLGVCTDRPDRGRGLSFDRSLGLLCRTRDRWHLRLRFHHARAVGRSSKPCFGHFSSISGWPPDPKNNPIR